MSTKKFNELRDTIVHDGKTYKKRLLEVEDFVVIEYSTEQVMTRHLFKPGKIPQERVDEVLLEEAIESSVDKAVDVIEEKIQKYI